MGRVKNLALILCLIMTLTSCRTKDQCESQRTRTIYDSTLTVVIPWNFDYPFDSLSYRPTNLSRDSANRDSTAILGIYITGRAYLFARQKRKISFINDGQSISMQLKMDLLDSFTGSIFSHIRRLEKVY